MTVGDLIEELEGYPEDAEVRLAIQPSWPFEHSVSEVTHSAPEPDSEEGGVVYVGEGRQLGYLPGSVADALGWGRTR